MQSLSAILFASLSLSFSGRLHKYLGGVLEILV